MKEQKYNVIFTLVIIIIYSSLVGFMPLKESLVKNDYDSCQNFNIISDLFAGGGTLFYDDLTQYPPQLNNGFLINGLDCNDENIERFTIDNHYLHRAYRFKGVNDLDLSILSGSKLKLRNYIFKIQFPSEFIGNSKNLTFGFWIDRTQLKGNGISFKKQNGTFYTFSNNDLAKVGGKALRFNFPSEQWIFEVTKVDGNYSFISFISDKETYQISAFLTAESNCIVEYLDIINPIMLEGNQEINPNKYYKSESEYLNSDKIGKLAYIIGDSQWQDRISARVISRKTGLNVLTTARGGHSIKYKNVHKNKKYFNWFYHQALREDVILKVKGIDYYILPLSSNDNFGGGVLSKESIQNVVHSYPYYLDSEATQKDKLLLFNRMDGLERERVFGYKQTFATLIIQLKLINPTAKFILTSIPISPGNMTGQSDANGHGVWKKGKSSQIVKLEREKSSKIFSRDTKEVANWFNAHWVDLKNNVGLKYENATQYIVDGVHWNREIKQRIGEILSKELEKM